MKAKMEIEPVIVFAGTSWQAGMVKSMLIDVEVEAFLRDDIIGTLSPWWTASGGVGSVKVFVSSLDYEKARKVINSYEKNLQDF